MFDALDPEAQMIISYGLMGIGVLTVVMSLVVIAKSAFSVNPYQRSFSGVIGGGIQAIIGNTILLYGVRLRNTAQAAPSKPKPKPEPEPAPEPIDINLPDINWSLVGIVIASIAGIILAMLIIVALIRRTKDARTTKQQLRDEITHIRATAGERLSTIMSEFTDITIDPVTVLKYPLYLAHDHRLNREFVDAMMAAYTEQNALDTAIAEYLDSNPSRINAERFDTAVAATEDAWRRLNYEAKRITSPLLPLGLGDRAAKLLDRALDEHNYVEERTRAMDKLIDMLRDARTQLHDRDERMYIDVALGTLDQAKRAGNVLVPPKATQQLINISNAEAIAAPSHTAMLEQ